MFSEQLDSLQSMIADVETSGFWLSFAFGTACVVLFQTSGLELPLDFSCFWLSLLKSTLIK